NSSTGKSQRPMTCHNPRLLRQDRAGRAIDVPHGVSDLLRAVTKLAGDPCVQPSLAPLQVDELLRKLIHGVRKRVRLTSHFFTDGGELERALLRTGRNRDVVDTVGTLLKAQILKVRCLLAGLFAVVNNCLADAHHHSAARWKPGFDELAPLDLPGPAA